MQERENEDFSFGNEEEKVHIENAEEGEGLEETSFPQEAEEETDEEKKSSEDKEEKRQLSTRKFISKLQRAKLKAEQEAIDLRAQVAQLEEARSYMNVGVLKQQEVLAHSMLEKAKLSKKQALETGDTDAIIQSDQDISSAAAQLEYLKMIPSPAPRPEAQSYQTAPSSESVDLDPSLEDWLEQNPWCDGRSAEYDPYKAASILAYAKTLDTTLERQGRSHEFYSPQYFSTIDRYARQYDQQSSTPRNLQMKPSLSSVSPVKSSPSRAALQQQREADLSPAEKEMARLSGISEENWKKYKKQEMKKIKEKGGPHVYR